MVDMTKGTDTFPDILEGAQYSTVVTTALDKVMVITVLNDIRDLLIGFVTIGQSSIFVPTYLQRASGRLHDSILSKLCCAIFDGLEDENRLSPSSCCTKSQKQ